MSRSRSASAHQKVLRAAIELIAEHGIDATSMDAVARVSGVSKATIYKHWSDKNALVLEVMAELNGLRARPAFDSGRTRADLIAVLAYRPPEHLEIREKIMPHFMAYASRNQEVGMAWRQMVMEPPRNELRRLLHTGIAKGELPRKLNVEQSTALLLGPMIYWFIFLRKSKEEPRPLAKGVVDAFWRAFGKSVKAR